MSFSILIRRIHLYLALTLMAWFLVYGISSIPFAHPDWFEGPAKEPLWTTRLEKAYNPGVPIDGDLRAFAAKVAADHGVRGAYGAYRPSQDQVNVYVHTFWTATQLNYYPASGRLVIQDRAFRWNHFLTGLHARGGFEQETFLNDFWGVMVDVVCLGFLLWTASGIYMWWGLPRTRFWGFVAIAAGCLYFAVFMLVL